MPVRPIDQIIHKAAWLYYTHGLRQDEVAQRLEISRASIAMYLRKAREMGIVTISTSSELFSDDVLARELEDATGLNTVWLVPEDRQAMDPAAEMPVVAASVFLELLNKGDRVGVAWGRTVYHIADVMPFADLSSVTVVQLCGNLGAPYSYRPDQCTTEIARRLNAEGINFYAPLVLSSERLADELRGEPVIKEQLATIPDCNLALYSVGGIEDDSHLVKCGALSAADMHAMGEKGAAGVIAGQLIDRDGQWLDCNHNRRCISADLASIRAIKKRMLVVQEDNKFEPLVAALKGDFASHLVITTSMARRILDRWSEDGLGKGGSSKA
ncbi:sugar-binding transcriptional regulator [Brucella anthropi]|jgi:DNA-binding transcriptional regulator LsrR (DeoR family)|uniref:Sugar-binding transcriptional regulator n=2 Tax=Brucella TaxID=234 RepID=A0A011UAH4_BRUAN|nr:MULTISPECIES: sugar-binding transcriptional regulator [Brucella/Ochrobactrum group]MCR5942224.1 sugar-binding transcriptional regulator [Ochrobactrum sp. XJ1]QOD66382.1 sugar-binding transcriptional regulator [Ochrobactrum sp. MT180101]QTN05756.1 sugar-binding transcriptional regulator [Ochrobactrum sp. EEELCW01]RNL42622.1 sugar-binding transcriptional regulator [Ochrobactrum sp. MH181795]EXL03136.1 regulatory protein [Brucella anthropi]